MYGTGAPTGVVVVVAVAVEAVSVVVVPAVVVPVAVVSVEVAALVVASVDVVPLVVVSVEVEAVSVVVAALVSVLVEVASVPVEVEVESLVESVPVAPVRTLTAPPSGSLGSATAPEANTPSTSRATRPNPIFNPRVFRSLRRMTPTSLRYDRPSLARPKTRERRGRPRRSGQARLISSPQ
jgi:hypothetical protein